jgi:aspartyl-tRNA(Asn)/glutamyl-tRNA(Gln) amidotransferase subunit C
MASAEEVKKLAALARVAVSDEDLPKFVEEFDAILAYVGQLESLNIDVKAPRSAGIVKNVMREDETPHEKGKYTEAIAAQFPEREGDYLKVKQIISND